jgi:ketosteroid isomerase-like protein
MRGHKDPKLVVLLFNQAINERDIDALSSLMSTDHTFLDSSNDVHRGKETMLKGWMEFFESYPDYRNHFSQVESRGSLVLITGHSTCSYKLLDGPALWTAKVENDLVRMARLPGYP